jgi:hypothetical protein
MWNLWSQQIELCSMRPYLSMLHQEDNYELHILQGHRALRVHKGSRECVVSQGSQDLQDNQDHQAPGGYQVCLGKTWVLLLCLTFLNAVKCLSCYLSVAGALCSQTSHNIQHHKKVLQGSIFHENDHSLQQRLLLSEPPINTFVDERDGKFDMVL